MIRDLLQTSMALICSIMASGTFSHPIFNDKNQAKTKIVSPTPFTKRVNIQSEYATPNQILDGQWVVVGTPAQHAFSIDASKPYQGKPSFRFELQEKDNSLAGYNPGETKGRIETSFCYATPQDFETLPPQSYTKAQRLRSVYHHGKGQCAQGSTWKYRFAIWVPDTLSQNANTIFAQWHGMPRRNLVQTPTGEIRKLTYEEFVKLEETTLFVKETGYEKIATTPKRGKLGFKKGKPNGWRIEQGGYPPLAFGFNGGYFYIKANSDRKWFSDKTDRTNANISRVGNMESVSSPYKTSTIAFKEAIENFPRCEWVTFEVTVTWSQYDGPQENMTRTGQLDVTMTSQGKTRHLVKHENMPIGRNDQDGYYFKYGIYRTSSSTIPVAYHLAGFTQEEIKSCDFR